MKKIYLMVAVTIMTVANVNAQDELKNEIGVYYGFGSCSDIISTFGTSFNFDRSDQTSMWGPVGVEYYYHVTPGVAFGAMASIAGCTWSKNSDASSKYITVMPSVKFNWLRKTHFGLYSSLAAGIMFFSTSIKDENGKDKSENITSFMGHATALGAEFGGPFRGFIELGFGERGMLSAGLRYKF